MHGLKNIKSRCVLMARMSEANISLSTTPFIRQTVYVSNRATETKYVVLVENPT